MAEPKLTPLVPVRPDVRVPLRLLLKDEAVLAGLQHAPATRVGVARTARLAACGADA